jgi:hypothetical protein
VTILLAVEGWRFLNVGEAILDDDGEYGRRNLTAMQSYVGWGVTERGGQIYDATMPPIRRRFTTPPAAEPVATILPRDPLGPDGGVNLDGKCWARLAALPPGTKLYAGSPPAAGQEAVYQVMAVNLDGARNGQWIDVQHDQYEKFVAMGDVRHRILYTTPQPSPAPSGDE